MTHRADILAQALTTETCGSIVEYLVKKRAWTIAKIAQVIGASPQYVRRIQSGKQSFQVPDVEALAKATRQEPALLLFRSIARETIPAEMQELYDLARQEVQRHQEFARALSRKPGRKRRSGTRAA